MTPRQRLDSFIQGKEIDRIPFHPLVMQHAAKKSGIPFGEYCQVYERQVQAMLHEVEHFGTECVHPAGFPYCEAEAYGLETVYPEDNLPYSTGPLITSTEDFKKIRHLDIESHKNLMNRVEAVALYKRSAGDRVYLCGHHEGVMAEYSALRGMSSACMDLYDEPGMVKDAMSVISENAKGWGRLQIEAGAECMSIGDAAVSQIGPELYKETIFGFHKDLVEYYHSLGARVKFHICGDISSILPLLIRTDADIMDIDHVVPDIGVFVTLLKPHQIFAGNLDPVTVLEQGDPTLIYDSARRWIVDTAGRGIISGGCEITYNTPDQNFSTFKETSVSLLQVWRDAVDR